MKFISKYQDKGMQLQNLSTLVVVGMTGLLFSCSTEKRLDERIVNSQTSGGKVPTEIADLVTNSVTCSLDSSINSIRCEFSCLSPTNTWFCIYEQNDTGPVVYYNTCNTVFTTNSCDTKPNITRCYQILEEPDIVLTFLNFQGIHSC